LLGERDGGDDGNELDGEEGGGVGWGREKEEVSASMRGGWLENDDIEEF